MTQLTTRSGRRGGRGSRAVAGLAVLLAVVTGAGTGWGTAQAAPVNPTGGHLKQQLSTPPPVAWTTCADAALRLAGAQCGLLTVPLDYAKPAGTKIKLALSWIRHRTPDASAQGIMLVNPGGPGASGLTLSRLGDYVPKSAGDAYDWIGFDPRGVGASQPRLTCDGSYFGYARPDYVASTPELENAWLTKSAGYAAACDSAGGALLDHTRTADWVRDMDSIRAVFKARQINFYGFSYGTYLGQAYASRYPGRVRRMVWDGVVDWTKVWYQANLDQDVAFEGNLDRYFAWLAQNNGTYHLGSTAAAVKQVWQAQLAKSRTAPLAGVLGPDEWTDAFVSAGYYVYGWADLADAFVAAVAGNYGPMKVEYDHANGAGPGSDNTFAVYNAVQCTDAPFPADWATWRADTERVAATAPFLTWSNTWYNAPCLTWGAPPAVAKPVITGSATTSVLMVAETYDAATPFSGALQARATFPRSVLIEGVNGTTHSGTLSGVDCVDNRIADYLLTGKVDVRKAGSVADVKCSAVPPPFPQAAFAPRATARNSHPDRLPADLRAALDPLATRR
jgi:pimeloyl-ACP methyl ester carboxylesterase